MIVQCFRDGTCEWCERHMIPCKDDEDDAKIGSYYTVICVNEPFKGWVLYHFAELPAPNEYAWWCSCCFREVDGDAEEWRRTTERHKHKELEPV